MVSQLLTARAKRAQAAIEFTVAIAAIVILFVGMVKVWAWMVNTMVWRQQDYERTRVSAATHDAAGTIDAQGKLTYSTPKCLRIFGETNVGAQAHGACQ